MQKRQAGRKKVPLPCENWPFDLPSLSSHCHAAECREMFSSELLTRPASLVAESADGETLAILLPLPSTDDTDSALAH